LRQKEKLFLIVVMQSDKNALKCEPQ
jgi:hypothetical protein